MAFRATELRLTSSGFAINSKKSYTAGRGHDPNVLLVSMMQSIAAEITAALAIDLEVMSRGNTDD